MMLYDGHEFDFVFDRSGKPFVQSSCTSELHHEPWRTDVEVVQDNKHVEYALVFRRGLAFTLVDLKTHKTMPELSNITSMCVRGTHLVLVGFSKGLQV